MVRSSGLAKIDAEVFFRIFLQLRMENANLNNTNSSSKNLTFSFNFYKEMHIKLVSIYSPLMEENMIGNNI